MKTLLRSARRTALLLTVAACGGGGAGGETGETTLAPGWERLADMPTGQAKFGVAALDGKLYVVGGYDTRASVWVYDTVTNTWSAGPTLARGTDNVAAVALAGRVWAIGGEAGAVLQSLDPTAGAWTLAPAAPTVRFASAAGALNGQIHVAGGWNASNTASASLVRHDVFDTTTSVWTEMAPLPTARNAGGGAVAGGSFYVVGGRAPGIRRGDQHPLASVEVYSPGTDHWDAAAPLPAARSSLAVAAVGARIYAFGGEDATGAVVGTVERLDTATNSWRTEPAMPYRSHGLGAVTIGRSIYVMGGFTGASDAVGTESKALYRYTPAE